MLSTFRYIKYVFVIFLFASCVQSKKSENTISKKAGGTFIVDLPSKINTVFSPAISNELEQSVANQIHLGLLRYNPRTLKLKPGICSHWDVDNTETIYVFHLDSTVYFHDALCFEKGVGRRVTANDVAYTFSYLATQTPQNKNFESTISRIKGAKEHYKLNADSVLNAKIEGVEVINDFTIKVTLEAPSKMFLYNLAKPAASIIAKEAVLTYGEDSKIGAGPFVFVLKDDEKIVLKKNPKYFLKDVHRKNLPYLDTIIFKKVKENEKEQLFIDKKLDALLFVQPCSLSLFAKKISNKTSYSLVRSCNSADKSNSYYSVVSSSVHNFYTNNMRILDFSETYKD